MAKATVIRLASEVIPEESFRSKVKESEDSIPVVESPQRREDSPPEAVPVKHEPEQEPQPELAEKGHSIKDEAPVPVEIDADLATTLGRPKMAEKPSGNLGKLLGGRSMLAMSAQSVGGEEEELSDTSGLDSPYDQERVIAAWKTLVEEQKAKNKMGLAATLATGGWQFKDPVIHLTVANQVQYEELKECATQLLHFVRVEVGNGRIALEVDVAEVEASVEFLTPKDRYQRWAEEKPALDALRKRLDLDLG